MKPRLRSRSLVVITLLIAFLFLAVSSTSAVAYTDYMGRPLYRLYRPAPSPWWDHAYTSSNDWRWDYIARRGYVPEGQVGGYILRKPAPGLADEPLYRYEKIDGTDTILTVGTGEWGNLQRAGYVYRRREGYVSTSPRWRWQGHKLNITVPVWRLWSGHFIDHFYTSNVNELSANLYDVEPPTQHVYFYLSSEYPVTW